MTPSVIKPRQQGWLKYWKANWILHVFLIPGMLYFIIFKYIPMYGVTIAFKDFNIVKGVMNSPWVGLKHFNYLWQSRDFWRVLRNSLEISMLRMVCSFPAPLLLALMLNEMRSMRYKRTMQTILYLPHFISWVIIVGILNNMLSPSTGIFNFFRRELGLSPIYFLTDSSKIRAVLVIAEIWKGAGWGTIVYMAAMTSIDPSLYEAAMIDGASRLQRIRYITLPCISSTIVVLLIMRVGSLMSNGFEEIYLLQNAMTIEVVEVFEVYSYTVGLKEGRYSFSTAVGLFTSVIGCVLLFITNYFSRKVRGYGLW
jgi:putative aldouronate transport system permease protein